MSEIYFPIVLEARSLRSMYGETWLLVSAVRGAVPGSDGGLFPVSSQGLPSVGVCDTFGTTPCLLTRSYMIMCLLPTS